MQYFDIYNYLLGLMNRSVQYYHVLDVSKATGSDDEDVEYASQILEENGIVRFCGELKYEFVGGIELMREFVTSNAGRGKSLSQEVDSKGIALKDITDKTWSLVKKEEKRILREFGQRRPKSAFEILMNCSDDETDDLDIANRLEMINQAKNMQTERKERLNQLIISFIEKKENYDPIASTFSPHMHVCYPDETPCVFKYVIKDDSHYFTDNGLFKRYLSAVTKNLPPELSECWIDEELHSLAQGSSLIYEDDVIYSDVDNSYDNDDLNGEISYFLKAFENYFTEFSKEYADTELTEADEVFIRIAVNTFLTNTVNKDFSDEDEIVEELAIDLLAEIVILSDDIKKTHAINIAEELIRNSKDENNNKNLGVFEMLLKLINSISDLEFRILRKAVKIALE